MGTLPQAQTTDPATSPSQLQAGRKGESQRPSLGVPDTSRVNLKPATFPRPKFKFVHSQTGLRQGNLLTVLHLSSANVLGVPKLITAPCLDSASPEGDAPPPPPSETSPLLAQCPRVRSTLRFRRLARSCRPWGAMTGKHSALRPPGEPGPREGVREGHGARTMRPLPPAPTLAPDPSGPRGPGGR